MFARRLWLPSTSRRSLVETSELGLNAELETKVGVVTRAEQFRGIASCAVPFADKFPAGRRVTAMVVTVMVGGSCTDCLKNPRLCKDSSLVDAILLNPCVLSEEPRAESKLSFG